MTCHRAYSLVVFLLGLVFATDADATDEAAVEARFSPVGLRWKLAEGQKYSVRGTMREVETEQPPERLTIQRDTLMEREIVWVVDSIQPNGDAEITQFIERMRIEHQGSVRNADGTPFVVPEKMLRKMKHDSAQPNRNDQFSRETEAEWEPIIGTRVIQTMDRRGIAQKFTMTAEMKSRLRPVAVDWFEGTFALPGGGLPEMPVAPGDTWSRTLELPDSPRAMRVESTLDGFEDRRGRRCARIEMKFTLAAAGDKIDVPNAAYADRDREAIVTHVHDIKQLEGRGTQYFDVEAGRLVEYESRIATDSIIRNRELEEDDNAVRESSVVELRIVITPVK